MQGSASHSVKHFDAYHRSQDRGQAGFELPLALSAPVEGHAALFTSTPVAKQPVASSHASLTVDTQQRDSSFVTPGVRVSSALRERSARDTGKASRSFSAVSCVSQTSSRHSRTMDRDVSSDKARERSQADEGDISVLSVVEHAQPSSRDSRPSSKVTATKEIPSTPFQGNVSSQSVVFIDSKTSSLPVKVKHNVSSTSCVSVHAPIKPTNASKLITIATQTPTLTKPNLSVCPGPSHAVRPNRNRLACTPIDSFCWPSATCQDKGVTARVPGINKGNTAFPLSFSKATETNAVSSEQGTSPSLSLLCPPEAPAPLLGTATQGPSVSSSPGLLPSSGGSATQGTSSSVPHFHSSVTADRENDSSDESENESVVLADPDDPLTELLPASQAFSALKEKIVSKYTTVKSESKVVERSSFQEAFEKQKPKSAPLRMTSAVKLRLAALDEELKEKKASSSTTTTFSPYLKSKDARYYLTDIKADFEAQASVLASMAGVLDQFRVKKIKNSKVAFKFTELDSIFKSAFRALEIWSYASASFEVLGDCFLNLREKLPQEHKEVAIQYASLLRCIDIALARLQISSAISSLRKGNMSCP